MAEAAVKGLQFPDNKKKYIVEVLDPLLEPMVHALLKEAPEKPVDFMMKWLRERQGDRPAGPSAKMTILNTNKALKRDLDNMKGFVVEASVAAGNKGTKENDKEDDSEEEEDDDDGEEEPMPPPPVNRGPRMSVSAEAYGAWNVVKEFTPPQHFKSEEITERLRKILEVSFLFSSLEKKDMDVVILAMVEVTFPPQKRIITEGEDGDHLYVIETGSPVCKKKIDGEDKVVKECKPGDVFGELALLYNAPRAASVEATDECKAWQLDRETFKVIVQAAATKGRERHDGFLQKVSLLEKMSNFERSQICDALKAQNFKKGEFVVKESEEGDCFYIVEEGTLEAQKGETQREVMQYTSGDFFGELALLKNQPRAASVCVTSEEAKVLQLNRADFKKLLPPLQDILARKEADYQKAG